MLVACLAVGEVEEGTADLTVEDRAGVVATMGAAPAAVEAQLAVDYKRAFQVCRVGLDLTFYEEDPVIIGRSYLHYQTYHPL